MSALLLIGAAGPVLAASDAQAVSTHSHATVDDAQRAQALLARAVSAYSKDPKRALVDFSMVGPYRDGDLYVYVVGENGVLRASGGSSVTLVGRDVRELKDADGKHCSSPTCWPAPSSRTAARLPIAGSTASMAGSSARLPTIRR
jgi:hypothetical protein